MYLLLVPVALVALAVPTVKQASLVLKVVLQIYLHVTAAAAAREEGPNTEAVEQVVIKAGT